MKPIKEIGRIVAGAYYDYQEVRLGSMNRIRDVIRKRNEGIEFDAIEEKKEKKTYEKKYRDGELIKTLDLMVKDKKITKDEYKYVKQCLELAIKSKNLETSYKTSMMHYINQEQIWIDFLSKIRGLGAILGANIIKSFDNCEKYDTVSALWKCCGLDVKDGHAPKRKKGEKLTYNPNLKTLMWKIADSFIKQGFYKDKDGNKQPTIYRKIYDNSKLRLREMHPEPVDTHAKTGQKQKYTDMHIHLMAIRKMVKIFLQHYWIMTRTLSKLPVSKPYVQEKLKHKHIITYKDVIKEHDMIMRV